MNYMAEYRRHGKDGPTRVFADSIIDWLPDSCAFRDMISSLDLWEICRLDVGQKYTDVSAIVWERIA